MFSAYLALAVLQREVHCVWAYVNAPSYAADDYKRVTDPWRLGIVSRWMRYATVCLGRCPEAFTDVLRPRVADVYAKALIGVCSVCGSIYGCALMRTRAWRSCTGCTVTLSTGRGRKSGRGIVTLLHPTASGSTLSGHGTTRTGSRCASSDLGAGRWLT